MGNDEAAMLRQLINAGVGPDIGQSLTRKVRMVNLASLLTIGLFGFFTVVLAVLTLWYHFLVYVLFTIAFWIPIYLNRRNSYAPARAFLTILVAIALVAVEFIARTESRGVFIICLLLLGVFLSESKKETVLTYCLVSSIYLINKMIPDFVDVSGVRHESLFAFWLNLLIGSVGIYVMVDTFIADGWKYQKQLTTTNTELGLQWAEADAQRAKATEQAEMLEQKNKELSLLNSDLLDGIRYARRIQQSMLVTKEHLQLHLTETLIFYKPKDLLSGDFYWSSEVDGHLFLAVADCTGHGVPGALMTVMGNNLLHQIVIRDEVRRPSEILWHLDRRISELLTQRTSSTDVVNDGMDMGLLRINCATGNMLFSSAKRPLYAFHAESGELTEYAASKLSVGGHRTDGKNFSDVEIACSPNDMLYLTTDGFTDQFGPKGKFLPKRFRALLTEIHLLPMPEQHRRLNETLLRWRMQEPQTDDVLVFGFRPPHKKAS
jgi:serine phosphatase RsbU (regulator of sigma subunit)